LTKPKRKKGNTQTPDAVVIPILALHVHLVARCGLGHFIVFPSFGNPSASNINPLSQTTTLFALNIDNVGVASTSAPNTVLLL